MSETPQISMPVLKLGDRGEAVAEVKRILRANGYQKITDGDALDRYTLAAVEVFKLQHLGPNGEFLVCTPEIDADTWWALHHPSGHKQRSGLKATLDKDLTPLRRQLIDLCAAEHAKDIHEIPDGSNRHPEIDKYFKGTGLPLGLAWCNARVSWILREVLGKNPIGKQYHTGVRRMYLMALDKGMITTTPKPGDIFCQLKTNGQGHTGFGIGFTEDSKIAYTSEGNCGNRDKMGKRDYNSCGFWIDAIQDDQSLEFTRLPNTAPTIGAGEATR